MATSQLNTIILDFTNLLLSYIDQIRSTYTISQPNHISIESIYFLDNSYQIQIKIIPASFLSHFLLPQQSLFDHYLLSLFNSLIKTYNLQMNSLRKAKARFFLSPTDSKK